MALTIMDKASIIAIKDCMAAKEGETILVVTDELKNEVGYNIYTNARKLGFESLYIEMKPGEANGEEPPVYVAELMKKFDVVFCPTDKSLTHTDARRSASAEGVRIATMPGITKDVYVRGLNADYKKIADLSIKLKALMEQTKIVRVTADNGTDITMDISGRKAIASKGLYHEKGEGGNLPTGETFVAPIEGTTNGKFVVDGSMAGIGVIGKTPLKFTVKDGVVTEITGGAKAKKLKSILEPFGEPGRSIAELGIGTNELAQLSGMILEDEKVLGTAHLAVGNNITMGGNLDVKIHLDGVIKSPSVYFDEKEIMVNGKLLVE